MLPSGKHVTANAAEGVGTQGPLHTATAGTNWCSQNGRQSKVDLAYEPDMPFLVDICEHIRSKLSAP